MKYYLIFSFLFFAASANASVFTNISGAFTMIGDFFTTIETFLFNDVPNVFQRFWAWAIEWFVKVKLFLMLQSIEFAWGIAKQILLNLNVMSEITAQVSFLPQDVKAALVQMRLFDAINVLLTAHVTSYVLRLF